MDSESGGPTYPRSLVDVSSSTPSSRAPAKPFDVLRECLPTWESEDKYRNPGPVQFQGAIAVDRPLSLSLASASEDDYVSLVGNLRATVKQVLERSHLGMSRDAAKASLAQARSLLQTMNVLGDKEEE